MAGHGDEHLERCLRAHLERTGPQDVLGLLEALREGARAALGRHREGRVHALLHRLLRLGRLHVVGWSAEGLARYGLEAPATPPDAPSAEMATEAQKDAAARRLARAVRGTDDGRRIAADVHAHRAALAAAGRPAAFGPLRPAQNLLRRVDRGRPSVLFPQGAADVARQVVLHDGPWIVGAIVAFLLIRAYVAEVFVIPSRSMEPTLQVDDRVLVFKPGGSDRPERFKVVTFERGGDTYVKRAVAFGGEAVALADGDVYVDGGLARKPAAVSAGLRRDYATWDLAAGTPEGWARQDAGPERRWHLDGPLWAGRPPPARRLPRDVPLRDVYVGLEARRTSDGVVALDLGWAGPGVGVDAAPVAYRLRWGPDGARLQRRDGPGGGEDPSPFGEVAPLPFAPAGGEALLRLAYVDGVLEAAVGEAVLRREIPPEARPAHHRHAVLGVLARGEGTGPGQLDLDRDQHWSLLHQLAVPEPGREDDPPAYAYRVPDDAIFVLGDNTFDSRDSRARSMGPVPQADLVGPVSLRIWPLGRIGWVR